jgi:N-acetylglucosamine-6-phosphate deacetylase
MRTLIQNGSVILSEGIRKTNLLVEDGIIRSVSEVLCVADRILDADGLFVSPGFIDIHLHGGGGHDFMEATQEAFLAISEYHLSHGTTSLVPTAVSAPLSEQVRFLEAFQKAVASQTIRARLLGAHLEGPYLSKAKNGAHDLRYLKNPDPAEYKKLLSDYPFIKRCTVAPELEGALEMGDYLKDHGVNASIGHSNAFGYQITDALKHGFTSVTHLYNAMSSVGEFLGKKEAGVAEMALLLKELYVEVIADLRHVPTQLIQLAYQNKTSERMILVSDCLSPAGQAVGPFFIGDETSGIAIDVREAAYLAGTTRLAGSIASADILLQNAVSIGIPLSDAVGMLSTTPARLLGVDDRIGSLSIGKEADIVLFDGKINVKHVFCKGIQVR